MLARWLLAPCLLLLHASSLRTTLSPPCRRSALSAASPSSDAARTRRAARDWLLGLGVASLSISRARADDSVSPAADPAVAPLPAKPAPSPPQNIDFGAFRMPFNHENLPLKTFLGKATIVFNLKLDDPQTITQFPALREIYAKYAKDGLATLAFPTEQGYFEPDDDETVRAKAKEYYGFDAYPNAAVFDKVDLLGPSAHPLYAALTTSLLTPNGYGRITLNYEKFLLDAAGKPVRRYPRKYSAYDMEADVVALLQGQPLPEETPAFQKAWREAKREAIKSEYAFRYNYNYYTSPDSMYKYNPAKDSLQPGA